MYFDEVRKDREHALSGPGSRLVRNTVRLCLLGIFSLPVVVALLLANRLGTAATRQTLLYCVGGLWFAAFAVAFALSSHRTAVNRR